MSQIYLVTGPKRSATLTKHAMAMARERNRPYVVLTPTGKDARTLERRYPSADCHPVTMAHGRCDALITVLIDAHRIRKTDMMGVMGALKHLGADLIVTANLRHINSDHWLHLFAACPRVISL